MTEAPIRKGDLVTINYTDILGGPLRVAVVAVAPSDSDPDHFEAFDPATDSQGRYRTAQAVSVFTASKPPGAAKAHATLVARRAAEDADDARRRAASKAAEDARQYVQHIRGFAATTADHLALKAEEAAYNAATPAEQAAIVAAWAKVRG